MLPFHYLLRSITRRPVRALLTMGGVGIAIFLSVAMIGLSRGLVACTRAGASPDTVIALSAGAESMEFSAIDPGNVAILRSSPLVQRPGAEPLVSPESLLSTFIGFAAAPTREPRRGVMRGVLPIAAQVHGQVHLEEGSWPERGFQAMVGRLAATKLGVPSADLAIGQVITCEGQSWTIVGIFSAGGASFEAEIWAPLDDVQVAAKRTDYSAVVMRTPVPAQRDDLVEELALRTDVRVTARSEEEYYAEAAAQLRPVTAVSWAMTALLVAGACFVGMNTMAANILGRVRELGVLVTLGYCRRTVIAAFLLESLAVSTCGGAIGAFAGLALDHLPLRIPMGAFRFAVDGNTIATGLALAVMIGVLGAAAPLLRVWRIPVIDSLRSL